MNPAPQPPRRIYLTGNTFPLREEIRAAGGRWDKERKAWWITPDLRPAMVALAQRAAQQKQKKDARPQGVDEDQRVIGDGTLLKDKTEVFIAWIGQVKKSGQRMARLITRDGRRAFWAAGHEVRLTRRYETALPLCALLDQIQNHD